MCAIQIFDIDTGKQYHALFMIITLFLLFLQFLFPVFHFYASCVVTSGHQATSTGLNLFYSRKRGGVRGVGMVSALSIIKFPSRALHMSF